MSVGRVSGLVRNVRAAQPSPEPGLGKAQVVTNDVYGPAKSLSGFFRGHTAEILHLNDAGERFILFTERFENPIQVKQLYLLHACFRLDFEFWPLAAAFLRGSRSCVVYQNLAHYPGYHRQEMNPVRKLALRLATQLQVRFMDERRGL
jgi:hypothetical protein